MATTAEYLRVINELSLNQRGYLGTISLKLLGGKLAPKLVHFVLRKELLHFSEMAPWTINIHLYHYAPIYPHTQLDVIKVLRKELLNLSEFEIAPWTINIHLYHIMHLYIHIHNWML